MNEFPDGWWSSALQRPSPHQDAWPPGAIVDMLVIHAISLPPQEFGGPHVDALFMGTLDPTAHPTLGDLGGMRVSAHFLIDRGGAVTQYVPLSARAWHAGVSSFGGVPACNDRALGIELEGADTCPFTDAQYARLVELGAALFAALPALRLSRVVGHADIAPGRKTDPGPCFDWIRFRAALAARITRARVPR